MVVISLGTNLGNRLNNLRLAVSLINQRCLRNMGRSIVLETAAILPDGAPKDWNIPYLNMIVCGQTDLSPNDLLRALKKIERQIGRPEVYEKWSPRVIDLDILLYNDEFIEQPYLTIPHPELKNRPFFQHLLSLMGMGAYDYTSNLKKSFLRSYVLYPHLVGIVNVTKDSFSDGGMFDGIDKAVAQIKQLQDDGASFVEIGVQSTRPGAKPISSEDEYIRLDEILSAALCMVSKNQIDISLDVLHPSAAVKLLKKYPIQQINNVAGNFDDNTLRTIADTGCKFCLMHSLEIPANKSRTIPLDINPISYLLNWGKSSLDRLSKLGFSLENLILDPGIGFSKTPYQDIYILKNIEKLKQLGCMIMSGHSRKSYIRTFFVSEKASDRDVETEAVSLAIADKVDFLRVHNVHNHMRSLVARQILFHITHDKKYYRNNGRS